MAREISTVGVVGLGTMGAGIVEVLARSGLDVVAVDVTPAAVDAGRGHLERSTGRAVARGRMTEDDRQALLARVSLSTRTEDMAGVDLVVEAVPERTELKHEVFARLDDVVRPDAVLATNTSSLSVTEIAAATRHPERVVGMHFFNPAPVLRLVEVVRTVVTDEGVVTDVADLARRLGKEPVVVADRAGFIANALLFGYLNRAVALVETGVVGREDVDAAMRLGAGMPMGPLALLDLIGLDTAYQILETMYRQGRDRLHAPTPLLRQLVTAGMTGRKSGRGFYTYASPGSGEVVADERTPPDLPTGAAAGTPRPVGTVAVVGVGPVADRVLDAFSQDGLDVRLVDPAELGASDHEASAGAGGGLAEADVVVEAVEEAAARDAVMAALGPACSPGAVIVTTARTVPVTDLAVATGRPEDVVGLHLPDPAPSGALAEVVGTVTAAPDAVATVVELCRRSGRHVVTCPDRAGRVVDALLFGYLNDAVRMLESGYAGVDDVDVAMTKGCGYPAGPFEVLDRVGLDVALEVQAAVFGEQREPGLSPAPLLQQLVTAGHLGVGTGRGFRTHPPTA